MPSDPLKNDEFQKDLKKVFGDSVENMTVQLIKKLYELWAEGVGRGDTTGVIMTGVMQEKLIQSMGISNEAMNPLTAPLKKVPSALQQMEKDLEDQRAKQAEAMLSAMAPMVDQLVKKVLDPKEGKQKVGSVTEYLQKVDKGYDR